MSVSPASGGSVSPAVFRQKRDVVFRAAQASATLPERIARKPSGRSDEIEERCYAISPERRLKHPSALLIANSARSDVFTAR